MQEIAYQKEDDVMFCKKCGSPLTNGNKFCGVCGAVQIDAEKQELIRSLIVVLHVIISQKASASQTSNTVFCGQCGASLDGERQFCGKCGAPQNYSVAPVSDIAPQKASLPKNKPETKEENDSDETDYLRMIVGLLGLYWFWQEQDQTLSSFDKGIKIATTFCMILAGMAVIYALYYAFTKMQGDVWEDTSGSDEIEKSWLSTAMESPLLFIHKLSILIIGVSFLYVFRWVKRGGLNVESVLLSVVLYTLMLFGAYFAIDIIAKASGIANNNDRKRKQIASVSALICTALFCWFQFK